MRGAVVLILLAPAFAGCFGASVQSAPSFPALGGTSPAFRYLCAGAEGEGALAPCLTHLPRGDAALQQPYVAIHPGDPRIMAVGVHHADATELLQGLAAGNASGTRLAVFVSEDGGATWRVAFAPPPAMSAERGQVGFQGDAALLFDPQGRLHVVALAISRSPAQLATLGVVGDGDQRTFYVRSDDLGRTWHEPVVVQAIGAYQDRPWIVRDPASGALFVVWQNFNEGHVHVAWSLDAGVTWRNQGPGQEARCYREGMPVVVEGALLFACVEPGDGGPEAVQVHTFDAGSGEAVLRAGASPDGRYPFLTLLADGTLALHYDTCFGTTSPPVPPNACALDSVIMRSADGGRTWASAGSVMGLAEDGWTRARAFWSEADAYGGQHLLVRYERDEPQSPADPSGRVLTPVAYEVRHLAIDRSGAVAHAATLAAWRTDPARANEWIPGRDDDGNQLGHPRCAGWSCFYGLAWAGDRALLAFSHDGDVELAAVLRGPPTDDAR